MARLAHIDLSINELQMANRRIEFCSSALGRAAYPEVISDLHRRLAKLYRGRGDDELARIHAMDALRACPRGDAHVFGPDVAPETRVAVMLSRIAASPADVRNLWDLGLLLDSLSMPLNSTVPSSTLASRMLKTGLIVVTRFRRFFPNLDGDTQSAPPYRYRQSVKKP